MSRVQRRCHVLAWLSEIDTQGVNLRSKYVTQVQQQRPESPTVTFTWHAYKYKVHKLYQRCIFASSCKDVPLVEFMYLVFTRMPGESFEDIPLVECVYLVFTCILYLHACQVRVLRIYLWYSVCTLYLHVSCIYTHAR